MSRKKQAIEEIIENDVAVLRESERAKKKGWPRSKKNFVGMRPL
jgi:hypothetical protein